MIDNKIVWSLDAVITYKDNTTRSLAVLQDFGIFPRVHQHCPIGGSGFRLGWGAVPRRKAGEQAGCTQPAIAACGAPGTRHGQRGLARGAQ